MPVTTYLNVLPGNHEDKELSGLVDEMCKRTGDLWVVETAYRFEKKLFMKEKKVEAYTQLYKHMSSSEYQVLTCVSTIREAKAYLFGAVGILEKVNEAKL